MSNKLEEELKKALRRVDPPAGFRERVLRRTAQEEAKHAKPRVRLPFRWLGMAEWRWAAASALCVVLAGSAIFYRYQRQERGEQAKEQVMLALQITSSKLQVAMRGVQEISSPGQRPE